MKAKLLSLLLAISVLLSGCAAGMAQPPEQSGTAVTFEDDLGRAVTVDRPARVAALLGSFAQVWMLAGGEVIATADDAWDDLGLALAEDTVNLGNTKQLSLELLLAAQPDFILASTNTRQNVAWQDTLEQTSIPVAYFDISNFEDYLRLLGICTDITGRKDLYETYGAQVREQISGVLEANQERLKGREAPTVLCIMASASLLRAKNSQGNVLTEMLKSLGCRNIADTSAMLLEDLSMEHILVEDPDYIFIVQRGDDEAGMRDYVQKMLMEDPLWSQLTAVRNGRVYFMEKALYGLKPNHRWGEAYEKLEEILCHGQ